MLFYENEGRRRERPDQPNAVELYELDPGARARNFLQCANENKNDSPSGKKPSKDTKKQKGS